MILRTLTFFRVLGSLRISLLCIVGELARGRFLVAAVAVSDRLQVTGDTGHVTHDFYLSFFLSVLVLVLLSAHVVRFSVSRMWNF